jgi:hypothetical protein
MAIQHQTVAFNLSACFSAFENYSDLIYLQSGFLNSLQNCKKTIEPPNNFLRSIIMSKW